MTNLRKAIDAMGDEATLARAMLDSMAPFGTETPVQEEVAAEISPGNGFFAFGTVIQCLDEQRAGRLLVASPAFPEGPQTCDYVSPVGGAGYGFFALPGIGATVIIGKVPYADPATQNFWFGCLYAAGQDALPNTKVQPYIKGQGEQLTKNEVLDNGEPIPNDPTISYGIPDENDVYRDNDLPDSFVLKHPAGHSVTLSDKNTPERQINEIKLKSAGNKRLILSDAPAEAGGDMITLADENKNGMQIVTTGYAGTSDDSIKVNAKGDIETYSAKGGISQTIGPRSKDDIELENAGQGDISIEALDGNVVVRGYKNIKLECGSCTIELTPNAINIDAPTVNLNGGGGDVSIAGVSLTQHRHYGNEGRPTSKPGMDA
tara:strand:+ start:993 stop:2117 length:1125 start_codon:yes stop_codon:yes gene_type:complete